MIWFSFTITYSVVLLVLKTFSSFFPAAASPMMGPTAFLSAQSLLKLPEHAHAQLQPPQKGACQGFPSPCTLPPRQYTSKSQEFDLAQFLPICFVILECTTTSVNTSSTLPLHHQNASGGNTFHTSGNWLLTSLAGLKNCAKAVLALVAC